MINIIKKRRVSLLVLSISLLTICSVNAQNVLEQRPNGTSAQIKVRNLDESGQNELLERIVKRVNVISEEQGINSRVQATKGVELDLEKLEKAIENAKLVYENNKRDNDGLIKLYKQIGMSTDTLSDQELTNVALTLVEQKRLIIPNMRVKSVESDALYEIGIELKKEQKKAADSSITINQLLANKQEDTNEAKQEFDSLCAQLKEICPDCLNKVLGSK